MVAWTFFDGMKEFQLDGTFPIDYDTDEIKIALYDNNAPDVDLDVVVADLPGSEMGSGNGYTTGGEVLNNPTVVESAGTVTFDADDVSWSQNGAGFTTARYAIMIRTTGLRLVAFLNFGSDKGNTTGDLTIEMDVAGIITLAG